MVREIDSEYYLAFGRQTDGSGVNVKVWVDLKLPEEWLLDCYDQAYIDIFINRVKTKYLNLGDLQSVYDEELSTVEFLLEKVKDFTDCCIPGSRNSCSSCITGDDVFFDLSAMDLVPSYLGDVTNSDTSVDQSCLCLNYSALTSGDDSRSSRGSLIDLANLIVAIDGESIDFGANIEDFLSYPGNEDVTGIVTKNENFCNSELINDLKTSYEDSEKTIWLHVWENYDSNAKDVIFFKMKMGEELVIEEIDFNLNGPSNADVPPPFEYEIEQRCFAPWDKFGDLPPFKATRNSFHGDGRSFSLDNFSPESSIAGATARTLQGSRVKLGLGIVPGSIRKECSLTYGFRNFIKSKPIFYPGTSQFKEYQDVPEQTAKGTVIGTPRSILHENITYTTMHYISGNPLVDLAWFAAPIEFMVNLNFGYSESESLLMIMGDVSGRGFPAHEVIIRDNCGNSTFVNTMIAPAESDLAVELLNPFHDYGKEINISIKIDEVGCFDDEINVAGETFDISDWNTGNLLKNPAVDCLGIPCEGTYKN